MNISTDFEHLSPNFDKNQDGYEWWYIDGLSADGSNGFVIIFYHDNPFSTKKIKDLKKDPGTATGQYYPAISVSVYKNSETIYYSFLEFEKDDFHWDEAQKKLRIGKNDWVYQLRNERVHLEIQLNQELASGHHLKGSVKATTPLPAQSLIRNESSERHEWNLLLPSLQFEARLDVNGKQGREALKFKGKGYHDHNTGHEPMKDSFIDWYWGRYHFGDLTLVYYLMNKHQGSQFEAWLLDEQNQSVLTSFDEVKMEYLERNAFGIRSARKIHLKSPEVTVNIQAKDKIDNGPFYQRFLGDGVLNYNGQVYGAHGISEFIYPKNIYKSLFWPLVHMRLRYVYKDPHWVQKSRLLYPWTW